MSYHTGIGFELNLLLITNLSYEKKNTLWHQHFYVSLDANVVLYKIVLLSYYIQFLQLYGKVIFVPGYLIVSYANEKQFTG